MGISGSNNISIEDLEKIFLKAKKGEQKQGSKYYKRVETGNPKDPYRYYYSKEAFEKDHPPTFKKVIGKFSSLWDKGLKVFSKKNVVKDDIVQKSKQDFEDIKTTQEGAGIEYKTFLEHWLHYWEKKEAIDKRFNSEQKEKPESISPLSEDKSEEKDPDKQKEKKEIVKKAKYKLSILKALWMKYGDKQTVKTETEKPGKPIDSKPVKETKNNFDTMPESGPNVISREEILNSSLFETQTLIGKVKFSDILNDGKIAIDKDGNKRIILDGIEVGNIENNIIGIYNEAKDPSWSVEKKLSKQLSDKYIDRFNAMKSYQIPSYLSELPKDKIINTLISLGGKEYKNDKVERIYVNTSKLSNSKRLKDLSKYKIFYDKAYDSILVQRPDRFTGKNETVSGQEASDIKKIIENIVYENLENNFDTMPEGFTESTPEKVLIDNLINNGFKLLESKGYEGKYLYRGKKQKFLVTPITNNGKPYYYSLSIVDPKKDDREYSKRKGLNYLSYIAESSSIDKILNYIKEFDLDNGRINFGDSTTLGSARINPLTSTESENNFATMPESESKPVEPSPIQPEKTSEASATEITFTDKETTNPEKLKESLSTGDKLILASGKEFEILETGENTYKRKNIKTGEVFETQYKNTVVKGATIKKAGDSNEINKGITNERGIISSDTKRQDNNLPKTVPDGSIIPNVVGNEQSGQITGNPGEPIEPGNNIGIGSGIGLSELEKPKTNKEQIRDENARLKLKAFSAKKQKELNERIKELLATKPPEEMTEEDKALLEKYEGEGGQTKDTSKGAVWEFYTPENVINKIWDFVNNLIPTGSNILEPSAGTGRFAKNQDQHNFDLLEIDPTSSKIASILHPESTVKNMPFEKMFITDRNRAMKTYTGKKYQAVVGNPPYFEFGGAYKSFFKGYKRYENFFLDKSLDTLEEGGILAMVVPSSVLNKNHDSERERIFKKADIVKAFRLPEGTFHNTQVGTDLIILRKNSNKENSGDDWHSGNYFENNPENILGETVTKKDQWGKEVQTTIGNLDKFLSLPTTINEDFNQNLSNAMIGNQNAVGLRGQKEPENKKGQRQKKVDSNKKAVETGKKKKQLKDAVKAKTTGQTSFEKEVYTQEEFNKEYNKNFTPEDFKILNSTNAIGELQGEWLLSEKVCYHEGKFIPHYLYYSGNIADRLNDLEKDSQNIIDEFGVEHYSRQKKRLESILPKKVSIFDLDISPIEKFAKEYTLKSGKLLKEEFKKYLKKLDSNIFSGLPISAYDIANYVDGIKISGKESFEGENRQKKKMRASYGQKLFKEFIQEQLSDIDQEELERDWNQAYNSNVPIDSSLIPVKIEGLSKTFKGKKLKIKQVQNEFVAKFMAKGIGCAAHQVGVGKTMSGIMATVSNMQAGNCKRPVIIVPTSVLPKWESEFKELYPGVPLNVVGTPKLNKIFKEGKGFIAEEGAVTILSYDAFKKFGFSDEKFEELTKDVKDQISDPGKKETKRTKASKEGKAEALAGRSKKDQMFDFDKAGFDHITVDEAHNFNNVFVEIDTKRFSNKEKDQAGTSNEFEGITGGKGSDQGISLWLASRHVLKENNNRNILHLTATPFTNSPLQVYSLLSMYAKERLDKLGIRNIRDFVSAYATVDYELTIEANGKVKDKAVMKSFKNAQAFRALINEYFDYKTGESAGIDRPELKRKSIILPESFEQKQMRADFEALFDADKDEIPGASLMSITNQRTLNLSPALIKKDITQYMSINPDTEKREFPSMENFGMDVIERSPKLTFALDSIAEFIKGYKEGKPGENVPGQIMFMPEGKDFLKNCKDYLVKKHGIDPDEVEILGTKEKGTKAKDFNKAKEGISRFTEISEDFNDLNGKCKVIIGTDVIKEGVDLNGNTAICYNTMVSWNPTDEQQKLGRAWRQGNKQNQVHFVDIMMEDSIDTKLFQKQSEKASRINQIFEGEDNAPIDVSDVNPEELKLDIIKDPRKRADLYLKTVEEVKRQEQRALNSDYYKLIEVSELYDDMEYKKKQMDEYERDTLAREFKENQEEYEKGVAEAKEDLSSGYYDKKEYEEKLKELKKELKEVNDRDKNHYIRYYKEPFREAENKLKKSSKVLKKYNITPDKVNSKINEIEKKKEKIEKDIDRMLKDERSKLIEQYRKDNEKKEKLKEKRGVDAITQAHVSEMLFSVAGIKKVFKSNIINFLRAKRRIEESRERLKNKIKLFGF